jgi:hypothetical protein
VQVEIAQRSGNLVMGGGGDIFRVKNIKSPGNQTFEVNLKKIECCNYYQQKSLPCRHMIIVFHYTGDLGGSARKTRQTIEKWWPKWSKSEYYVQMFRDKSIRIPKSYPGPFTGEDHHKCAPPTQKHRKPGRPKVARYKGKKRTVKTIREQMPIVYHAEYASVLQHF